MRPLSQDESTSVAFAERVGTPYTLVHVTRTALEKSYWDATESIRDFLTVNHIHNYHEQPQGQDAKRRLQASTVTSDGSSVASPVTLYRPLTKQGDPRMWFSRMNRHADADDILMLVWVDECLWAVNLTGTRSEKIIARSGIFSKLFKAKENSAASVLEKLLREMSALNREGFIPAIKAGDTAVGHLLESRLGISANSKQAPDFMNTIELKSTRAVKSKGHTLFAKVADWNRSPFKGSGEILDTFGYERIKRSGATERALNCSVDTLRENSQGLRLKVDAETGFVVETSDNKDFPIVAKWSISDLEEKLSEKHKHTLWVNATSEFREGKEFIRFDSGYYRSRPVLQQFVPLLESGEIYMDHLISQPLDRKTGAREAGPLFKIRKKSFDLLFPDPTYYDFSIM